MKAVCNDRELGAQYVHERTRDMYDAAILSKCNPGPKALNIKIQLFCRSHSYKSKTLPVPSPPAVKSSVKSSINKCPQRVCHVPSDATGVELVSCSGCSGHKLHEMCGNHFTNDDGSVDKRMCDDCVMSRRLTQERMAARARKTAKPSKTRK